MTTKTYLVTGAGGFIGYYLAEKLSRNPVNSVIVVDNFVRHEPDDLYLKLVERENVRELRLDLSSDSCVDQLPGGIDVILHMAALNGTQNFYERPFDVIRHSTLPLFNVLERYKSETTKPLIIYAGSSEAYAGAVTRFGWTVPTAEDVPLVIEDALNARWSYGGSKLFGEIVTINGARNFDMPFAIIRYHNVYGPRMGDKHVVPDFLARARNGELVLYGYDDTRSFLYIDDAVDATLAVTDTPGLYGGIVNIGSPDEMRIEDLGRAMMTACQLEGELRLEPSPAGSVKRRAPDITKLVTHTGWKPKVPLDDGLRRAGAYYLDQPSLIGK